MKTKKATKKKPAPIIAYHYVASTLRDGRRLRESDQAHLATQRALVRCMDQLAESAEALESEQAEERHAEYQNITALFGDLWDIGSAARIADRKGGA